MRWRSGQPGSPYIIGRGRFFGVMSLYCWIVDYVVQFRFFLSELCRFEDSAEFPPCIFTFQFLAYIINGLSFAFICALLERSGEIVVRLRVGTHCEVSPVASRVPRIWRVTKVVSEL